MACKHKNDADSENLRVWQALEKQLAKAKASKKGGGHRQTKKAKTDKKKDKEKTHIIFVNWKKEAAFLTD
uniref:Uncharacterized protein n=1 Tax=Moniliophthora roreri TaxID=221103 RepID=A0A0W0FWV7_MONRR